MKVELLAPVGNLENFQAAMNGGADAVYVGAPGFNARNPAREMSFEEIYAVRNRCAALGKKLYFAANSLILQKELPAVVKSLALIDELSPDALIVQDYGLVRLVQEYFPKLVLHGSTLMTVQSSAGAEFLENFGFERAVLARELTLKEIETISKKKKNIELEIFIHGAMCFSYSGLCLFSSYLGGKSGLRGRCVQPCRRAYRTASSGKKGDKGPSRYLFSMNDLNGLEIVSTLARLGISSLKIEGRLRSAHYVETIVRAYRLVLDSLLEDGSEGPDYEEALKDAKELEKTSMSRATSSGYFFTPQPVDAITPGQSGNVGIHLGRFSAVKMAGAKPVCRFILGGELKCGDRLRLHLEPSGERVAFRLNTLFVGSEARESAQKGERASLELPADFNPPTGGHVEVYKVDGASGSIRFDDFMPLEDAKRDIAKLIKKRERDVRGIISNYYEDPESPAISTDLSKKRRERLREKKLGLEWWLKLDNLQLLNHRFPFAPERYLINFEKTLYSRAAQIKQVLGKRSRQVVWALPPIIGENDLAKTRKQIDILIRTGFRSFQISHPSQLLFFAGEKVHLFGNYTLNIMNIESAIKYAEFDLDASLVSVELDQPSLVKLFQARSILPNNKKIGLGMYIYGAPALYTARLNQPFPVNKELMSPRDEAYVVIKKEGVTETCPTQPFSLLPYVDELKEMGVNYVVVDSCGHSGKNDIADLEERLKGTGRYRKLPTFNFLGQLQ